MRDLTGKNIKALKGTSRLISIKGDEAVILEKYKGELSVHVCVIEGQQIKAHFSYHELAQKDVLEFLSEAKQSKSLTRGIRIGPLFKGEHIRRIIVMKKKQNDAHFIKVEPLTRKDREWASNGSGWVPVANLSHKASGLVIFIRGIEAADLIEIGESYTKQGIFFLKEGHEVYIENVKKSFAFGKLIPRGL